MSINLNINLAMDFSVNKETHTITVKREFAAEVPLVWKAFTTSEILDQWWAPKPWRTRTKSMDFSEGGHWLYAMVGPEGEEHWAFAHYLTIQTQKGFTATDGFSDSDGKINTEMPQSKWETEFTAHLKGSLVVFQITYNDLAQLETTIQMGFKEGLTAAMEGLDEYFAKKITVKAIINAPIKKVWENWTKPEHITKWNFASDDWQCPKAENDMRVGGKYNARMEAKDGSFGFDFWGIYDKIETHKMIAYTLGDNRKVETTFVENGNQTEIITIFDAENENPVEMQQQGWQMILNNFKKYTENEN
jgi:uncharacterized protein YndB with AHSA1/START domain